MLAPAGSTDGFLKWNGRLRRWSFEGYGPPEAPRKEPMRRLTPASIAAVLAAGYVPTVHISARTG